MRGLLLASFLVCAAAGAGQHTLAAAVDQLADGNPKVLRLKSGLEPPTPAALVSGAWDAQFEFAPPDSATGRTRDYWLKLDAVTPPGSYGVPVVVVHASRQLHAELFMSQGGRPLSLPVAANLSGFLGIRDSVFAIPEGLAVGQPLYAHIVVSGASPQSLRFSTARLDAVLSQGAQRARMIAFAFGALCAVSLSALLIWFVLKDRLFVLYATLFFLQALYVAYLSGQGFDWPWLAFAVPLASFAWNIPAALSGAVACLFTREIADLKHYSPRVYTIFGSLSAGFVLLACANAAKLFGFGPLVNALGNIMFLGLAIFTAVVCFLAWRRGNRAAGWFLIAWALLEGFIIAAATVFLLTSRAPDLLYYEGLPLSMVAAIDAMASGDAVS